MPTSPTENDATHFLALEAAKELVARLPLLRVKPKKILIIGEVTGEIAAMLNEIYPEAECFKAPSYPHPLVQITAHSIDLLIANFYLPWVENPNEVLAHWRKLLMTDGVVVFNAFGQKTFNTVQTDWQNIIIPGFSDIHNLGDSLTAAGFLSPVLMSHHYHLNYKDPHKLLQELRSSNFLALEEGAVARRVVETPTLHLTLEIIEAHAFAPPLAQSQMQKGEARFSVTELKKTL